MKINVEKQILVEKLSGASQFISTRSSSPLALQGVFLQSNGEKLFFVATNLNSYYQAGIPIDSKEKINAVIEPRKFLEFIQLLPPGKIEMSFTEKSCIVVSGKTRGLFPLLSATDFPLPPQEKGEEQKISVEFMKKNLPLVLFSASQDEARPVLTGINFVTEDDLLMVSTDGFRLSYLKTKKEAQIPSVIIPGSFLEKVLHFIKDEKEITFSYLSQEKMVKIQSSEGAFYSRLIEGDFPPFEKVIPPEYKTKVTIETDDFVRNVKLASVFARDFSSIIILSLEKEGISLRPKMEGGEENGSYQEAKVEGEPQKIAFNFKFLLDFLSKVPVKTITMEVLRSDAPVVFRIPQNPGFLHIIMPVRIQE